MEKLRDKFNSAESAILKENYEEAFALYKELSEAGYDSCFTMLGSLYFMGKGTKKNNIEAERWLRMSAENGYLDGQFYLAKLYWEDNEADVVIDILNGLVKKDYSLAIFRLGRFFEDGTFVKRDTDTAMEYYRKAMECGHVFGENRYGLMLLKGYGGFRYIPKGIIMYIRSFVKGIRIAGKFPLDDSIRT